MVPTVLGAWIGAAAFNASLAAFLFGFGAGAIVQVIVQLTPSIRDDSGRTPQRQRSRAHRDEVNAKAMKDPRMGGMNPASMPFDGKRMFFGGFKPFIEV